MAINVPKTKRCAFHEYRVVVPRYAGGDPRKIFKSTDVAPLGMDQQMDVARTIREALSAT